MIFELTKTIMGNSTDTSVHNFTHMSANTHLAFEFMKRLLNRSNQQEEKLLFLYQQTCKIELVVHQLIKKIAKQEVGSSSNIFQNYLKNVIIHIHQNILYFLEIATMFLGSH